MSDVTKQRLAATCLKPAEASCSGCGSPGALRRAGSEDVTWATRRAARVAPANPNSNLQSEAAAIQRDGSSGIGPTAGATTIAHFKTLCKQLLRPLASGSSNINTVKPDRQRRSAAEWCQGGVWDQLKAIKSRQAADGKRLTLLWGICRGRRAEGVTALVAADHSR